MELYLKKADQTKLEAYFFFYYPTKEEMVLNALLAGLVPGEGKS